jgi:hypothetical protein
MLKVEVDCALLLKFAFNFLEAEFAVLAVLHPED